MTKAEMIQDAEYLFDNLLFLHKDIYKLTSIENYKNLKTTTLNTLKDNLTREQFEVILLPIFSALKDPHTGINTRNRLPVVFEWIHDGYYLTVVPTAHVDFFGKKLISVNNVALETYVDLAQNYVTFENDDKKKIEIAGTFRNIEVIKFISKNNATKIYFEFEGSCSLVIDSSNNERIQQISLPQAKNVSLPFLVHKTKYEQRMLNNMLYIRYTRCREDSTYSLNTFVADINESLLKHNPSKIAVDVRGNSGGNSDLFMPVLDLLEKYITCNHNIKVYEFINRDVFSSGILNAYQVKDKLGSLLVGQSTGQGVDHFGEVKTFQLPISKITVNYSTKYFSYNNKYSKQIRPDIFIEPTIQEYLLGIDAVLEYALNE